MSDMDLETYLKLLAEPKELLPSEKNTTALPEVLRRSTRPPLAVKTTPISARKCC